MPTNLVVQATLHLFTFYQATGAKVLLVYDNLMLTRHHTSKKHSENTGSNYCNCIQANLQQFALDAGKRSLR